MSFSAMAKGTDGMRQRNLSSVLQTVALNGPLTRSELTRRTGLNRSTIGALVGELVKFGFVEETSPATSAGVGRPSQVISVNDGVTAITVRPLADAIVIELVGLGGVIRRQIRAAVERTPTVGDAINMSSAIIEAFVANRADNDRLLGIGVAIAGSVRQRDGYVLTAEGLGWAETPFGHLLGDATGLSVVVNSDSQLAAIAEHLYGAAQGTHDMLYLTGDAAGIRGGVIAQDKPLAGHRGFAGDIGHLEVEPGGAACRCGRHGCLDAEIGLLRLLDAAGAGAAADLADVLTSSRAALEKEVRRQSELLARALGNVARMFDPATIVLDGYLRTLAEQRRDRMVAVFDAVSPAKLTLAKLTEDNVTIGAAQTVFGELLENPGVVAQRFTEPADDSQHWSRQRLNPEVFKRP